MHQNESRSTGLLVHESHNHNWVQHLLVHESNNHDWVQHDGLCQLLLQAQLAFSLCSVRKGPGGKARALPLLVCCVACAVPEVRQACAVGTAGQLDQVTTLMLLYQTL